MSLKLIFLVLLIQHCTSSSLKLEEWEGAIRGLNFSNCPKSGDSIKLITRIFLEAHKPFGEFHRKPLNDLQNSEIESNERCITFISELESLVLDISLLLRQISDLIILNHTEHLQSLLIFNSGLSQLKESLVTFQGCVWAKKENPEFENSMLSLASFSSAYFNLIFLRLNDIRQLSLSYQNQIVSLITALIKPEQYVQAEITFYQQNDNSLIHPIMDNLYGMKYADGLSAFTQMLRTTKLRVIGIKKWYDLYRKHSKLTSGDILLLWKVVDDEIKRNPGGTDPELYSMHSALTGYAQAVITDYSIQIQIGANMQEIADFVSPPKFHQIGFLFRPVDYDWMSILLDLSLGMGDDESTENFLNVVKFTSTLNWNSHRYHALNHLYTSFDTNPNRRFIIAFQVQETMKSLNGPDSSTEEAQREFERLLSIIPDNIKKLISEPRCYLKNVYKSQYLSCTSSGCSLGAKQCGSLFNIRFSVTGETLRFAIFQEWSQSWLNGGATTGSTSRDVKLESGTILYNWNFNLGSTDTIVMRFEEGGQLIAEFKPGLPPIPYIWTNPIIDPPSNTWRLECV